MIDFFQNTANIGNNSVNNFFDNTFIPASISAINSTQVAINRPKNYDYMILKPDIMDRGMPFNDFQISTPLVAQYDTIQTVKAPDDIPFNNTQVFQPMEYTRPKTLAQLMNIPASTIQPQIINDYIPPPPPPPNIIDNYTPTPIIDNTNITNNLKSVIPTLTTSLQNLNNDITQQQFNTNKNDTIIKTLQSSDVITSLPPINITPVNLSSQTIQIDFKNSLVVADQLQKNIIDNNKNENEKQFNLLNSNINKLVEMNAEMNTNYINYKIANNINTVRSNNNFTDFTPQQQTNNNNIAFLLFIPILSILLKNV